MSRVRTCQVTWCRHTFLCPPFFFFTCSLALQHCAFGLVPTENMYISTLSNRLECRFLSPFFPARVRSFSSLSLSSLHSYSDSGTTKRETESTSRRAYFSFRQVLTFSLYLDLISLTNSRVLSLSEKGARCDYLLD